MYLLLATSTIGLLIPIIRCAAGVVRFGGSTFGGLTSGQTYRFQYVVDGVIKIAICFLRWYLTPQTTVL